MTCMDLSAPLRDLEVQQEGPGIQITRSLYLDNVHASATVEASRRSASWSGVRDKALEWQKQRGQRRTI